MSEHAAMMAKYSGGIYTEIQLNKLQQTDLDLSNDAKTNYYQEISTWDIFTRNLDSHIQT